MLHPNFRLGLAVAKEKPATIHIPGMGAMQALKFGPGIIGRTAPIPIAIAVVCLAAIWAVHANPWMVLGIVGLLIIASGAYVAGALWYGHTHPENAVLEGSTVVDYKRVQNEQAASRPEIIDVTPTPVSNTAPPTAISHGDVE